MPYLLLVEAEVKRSLGIATTDVDQDTLLIEIENRAVRTAESITNRSLVAVVAFVELLQGEGTPAVFARSPFDAKPTVELRNSVTEAWATLDASFVEVDLGPPDTEKRRRRVIRLSTDTTIGGANNFPTPGLAAAWFDNVRLTYNAGYAAGAAPEDLEQAILWIVTDTYRRRIKRTGTAGQDDESKSGNVAISSAAREILRLYTTRRHKAAGRLELA